MVPEKLSARDFDINTQTINDDYRISLVLMILNIVLTLDVVVCLFCCLFLRARNKALCHSQPKPSGILRRRGIADGKLSLPPIPQAVMVDVGVVVTLVADVGVAAIDVLFAGVRWWGAIHIGNFDGFFRKGCGRGLWLVGREVERI
ncbi:hypothetical protein [Enterobacter cloacae complex sp. 288G10]|uniref:hypothetical protein n=1 Tax=Enterobacter cloacae complex sp. 288G10 TaxID=3395859 RepID=UPI003CE70088